MRMNRLKLTRVWASLCLVQLWTTKAFLLSTTPPTHLDRWRAQSTEDPVGDSAVASGGEDSSTPLYYSPNVPLSLHIEEEDGNEPPLLDDSAAATNEYSFFDEAIVYVRAGSGGQGGNSYIRIGTQRGPPDGGNGGNGGNVVLVVDPSLNTLAGLTTAWRPNAYGGSGAAANVVSRRKSFRAENGTNGERKFRDGKTGKDVIIRVPPGTVVEEAESGLDTDDDKITWSMLGSLSAEEDRLVVANGGEGGEGTGVQRQRGVKRPRLPSTGGERKILKLTLKIVADVALVGVPNAGKSTTVQALHMPTFSHL